MLARVHSCALLGIDAYALAVEVDSMPGMQKVLMVGLPDVAVKESEQRVGSAIRNSGFRFPRGHVVINLAPADMRKEGSALDLPIAVGMLAASDQLAGVRLGEYVIAGELALDGSLRVRWRWVFWRGSVVFGGSLFRVRIRRRRGLYKGLM
jgi:magnesium chelatase family protein